MGSISNDTGGDLRVNSWIVVESARADCIVGSRKNVRQSLGRDWRSALGDQAC
jgi:hypothetical protein